MFILAAMKDVVTVTPWNFGRELQDSLSFALDKKLANKVVHEVGLCIALFDITEIGDSYILPSNGSSHTPVKFRYVVFRPFIDEVLVGRIKRCSAEGVYGKGQGHEGKVTRGLVFLFNEIIFVRDQYSLYCNVTMTFFDDIFIPAEYLQQESVFNEEENVWVWKYQTDEGLHDLFMDPNEEIRFRVFDEEFIDLTPSGPAPVKGVETLESTELKKAPYTITGSIREPGLGLLSWWS